MLTATHHQADEVGRHQDRSTTGWSIHHTLTRHRFTGGTGGEVTWWELDITEGVLVGGEGESYQRRRLYTSEADARTAFRTERHQRP